MLGAGVAAVHPTAHHFSFQGACRGGGVAAAAPAASHHRSVSPSPAMGHHADGATAFTPPEVHPHVGKVLYSQSQIASRVTELARDLSQAYYDKSPVVLQVLCGAFMFAADLCRQMHVPGMQVDAVRASSYGHGTETSGTVILSGLTTDVSGRHVVLVEDIVDTGLTIAKLKDHLEGLGAASVCVVTLLNKAARRKNSMTPDFVGFECPDEFVIGYGLDYAGKYRELSYIGVLRPEFI